MIVLLLIAGLIDFKYRKIPNGLVFAICIYALLFSRVSAFERLAGFLAAALPLFILAMATDKLKGGDIKFLSACAVALGLTVFLKTLFFATIAAIIWSVVKKEKSVPLAYVFVVGYLLRFILWV